MTADPRESVAFDPQSYPLRAPWRIDAAMALWRKCGYRPHPGQYDFHRSLKRFRIVICGTRWGKSLSAAAEIVLMLHLPDSKTWLAAPTYSLCEPVWQHAMRMLKMCGLLPATAETHREGTGQFKLELANGARFETRSAENPDTMLGDEVDLLVIDEASRVPQQVWERELRARLASRRGRLCIPTTPSGATGWVRDLFEAGQRQQVNEWRGVPWVKTIQSWMHPSLANPYFSVDEWNAAKDTLPAPVFAEQYGGNFVTLSAGAYSAFDSTKHVGDFSPQPAALILALDFNIAPAIAIVLQRLPHPTRGRLTYAIDEIVLARGTTAEVMREFVRRHGKHCKSHGLEVIGDATGNSRHATGATCYEEVSRILSESKINYEKRVPSINPPVIDRINSTNAAFEKGRYFVSRRCRELIADYEQVQFRPGTKELDKTNKARTHYSDAAGYDIHQHYGLGEKIGLASAGHSVIDMDGYE